MTIFGGQLVSAIICPLVYKYPNVPIVLCLEQSQTLSK